MKEIKILSPTGHLGFTPLEKDSFFLGVKKEPDYIIADSGSADIGPYYLGADEPCSPEVWQRHDLEVMLKASRELDVPMIIGSASDTGTNSGVDRFVRIIKDIARENDFHFKLAYIYSQQDKESIKAKLNEVRIEGLDGFEDLTPETVDRTDTIVAVMGPEPIIEALNNGADVIIAGRSSDSSIFAAPLIREGISKATAFYAGKVLECASFCAEPFMGKESVMGYVKEGEVIVEAMHPQQRCTIASVASHSMYERTDPFYERVPGGVLDMSECVYENLMRKKTRVTGFKFRDEPLKIKLEGAGKVGERCLCIVGFRDPYLIKNIDKVIEWSRKKVEERYSGYQLFYHVYGINGIMKELEPVKDASPHEVCLIVECVANTAKEAQEIATLAARNTFYARLPEVKGTAGTAAMMSDEAILTKPAYEWTMNHVMPVSDPLELFEIHYEEV